MRAIAIAVLLLFIASLSIAQNTKTDREQAGLIGLVKTVSGKSVDYTGEIKGDGFMKKGEDLVTYDQNGFEIDRRPISDFGEAMGRMTRTPDADGLVKVSEWFDPKGNLISRDTYVIQNGLIIEQRTYDGKQNLIETVLKTYDAAGKLKKETCLEEGKPIARTEFKRGPNSVEAAFFMTDGSKAVAPVGPCLGAHRVLTTYDDAGHVTSQSYYQADGKLKRSAKYTYDSRGRVAQYVGGTTSSTTTRPTSMRTTQKETGSSGSKRRVTSRTASQYSGINLSPTSGLP